MKPNAQVFSQSAHVQKTFVHIFRHGFGDNIVSAPLHHDDVFRHQHNIRTRRGSFARQIGHHIKVRGQIIGRIYLQARRLERS